MRQLLQLGTTNPSLSGRRGSYALLGYKRHSSSEVIPWVTQCSLGEGLGVCVLNRMVQLQGVFLFFTTFLNFVIFLE